MFKSQDNSMSILFALYNFARFVVYEHNHANHQIQISTRASLKEFVRFNIFEIQYKTIVSNHLCYNAITMTFTRYCKDFNLFPKTQLLIISYIYYFSFSLQVIHFFTCLFFCKFMSKFILNFSLPSLLELLKVDIDYSN